MSVPSEYAFSMPISATFFPTSQCAAHRGGQRQLDLIGRNLAGQVMHGVELRDRLLVGAVVPSGVSGPWPT
jgi:hypothetical protein